MLNGATTVEYGEASDLSGNFETDYLDSCKKAGLKPLSLLKFNELHLPPLPLKAGDITPSISAKNSVSSLSQARGKSLLMIAMQDDEPAATSLTATPGAESSTTGAAGAVVGGGSNVNQNHIKIPVPSRRVLSEKRENSIQEFLKKCQPDIGSSIINLYSPQPWIKNRQPYTSRFKFTPTIALEHAEGDEGEPETLYKLQMRGYRISMDHLDILSRLAPTSMSSLTHLTIWNCGLNDAQFNLFANIITLGAIRHIALDSNPLINETNYPLLLNDESCVRTLSIRGNNITDVGVKLLAAVLKNNHTLIGLDLFDNRIQKFGAEALADAVRSNSCLQWLCLAKNHIGDEGVHFISRALMNIPLSLEEVAHRKKIVAEVSKLDLPTANDDDLGKRKVIKKAGSITMLKGPATTEKDTKDKKNAKPAAAAAVTAKKGAAAQLEPNPPLKGGKTPDDPKTKKLATATVEEKKGGKKAAAALPIKGKKGGNGKDEKDDSEDVAESSIPTVEPMFEVNGQWHTLGNRTLNSLNFMSNGVSDLGVKYLLDLLNEQENTSDQAPDGLLGVFKINLSYNQITQDNAGLVQLHAILQSKNPFHEPNDSSEDGGEAREQEVLPEE